MRLANKTALITGGNSGIGLATAKLFVAEGAKVVITGRNQATLHAAAKELGPNALALVADANDIEAMEAAIKKGAEKFGKYDIVFANAGIPGNTPIGDTTLAAFESARPLIRGRRWPAPAPCCSRCRHRRCAPILRSGRA